MIPALLLWVAMGQQPAPIKATGTAPAAQHRAFVIAGDGVELKAQPNGDVIAQKSEPLKCGKYEHFEPAHSEHTGGDIFVDYPDRCVPDMHTVTEKEWQELKEHIRTLERLICTDGHGVLHQCPAPSPER